VEYYVSGFIIGPTGIIVTNRHDGRQISARLLTASPLTDVTLLKVGVDHSLPASEWGDSDTLRMSDPVLTIGNDLGRGMSASAGIISRLNRNLQDTLSTVISRPTRR
jgi:S1-C subfamily serine protease